MGVRGLFSFLKKDSQQISLDEVKNSPKLLSIAIDISYYIHKWQASSEKVLAFLEELKPHKILLIFDGRAPDDKIHEHERRIKEKEGASTTANALKDSLESSGLSEEQKQYLQKTISLLEKQGWQNTKESRHKFKATLYEKGVPLLKSKGEADSLLVSLAVHGKVDIVISADMDLLVQGVPIQWCPIGTTGTFCVFNREEILESLGITCKQLRHFCALCSTDYSEEKERLDIIQAYQGIKIYKNISNLMQKHPEWLSKWPKPDHPFFLKLKEPTEWVLDEQKEWYEAWLDGQPMPYHK